MEIFKKMLKEYLLVENMQQARMFSAGLGCSDHRKEVFLRQCKAVLDFNAEPNGIANYDYDQCQDYVDGLRRTLHQGIGL